MTNYGSLVWRYAAIDATCRQAGPVEDWLTPRERQVHAGLRDPGGAPVGWPAGFWPNNW